MRALLALVLVSRVATAGLLIPDDGRVVADLIPDDGLRQDQVVDLLIPRQAISEFPSTVTLPAVGGGAGEQPDAGTSDAGFPDYQCPIAPPAVALDGGWWLLSPARASRDGCLLDARKMHLGELLKAEDASAPPSWVWMVVAFFVGGAVGVAGAKLVK